MIRRHAARALLTLWRACLEFVDDRGHRDAAQIAFFAVFSFVPLGLLLVGSFGLIFDDAEVRERLVVTTFEAIPLGREGDRAQLEQTVREALTGAGRLSPWSVVLLVGGGSGLMSALRHAVNEAWDIHERPPLLRRKALDVALVLGARVILLFSLSLTATRRAAAVLDDEAGGGHAVARVLDAVGEVLPFAFLVLVILFLYKVLPMRRPRLRDTWHGAVVAALGLLLLKNALEVYLESFANFGVLYGSLGALMALLLFLWGASIVLVFGAEYASEWGRLPDDDAVRDELRGMTARIDPRRRRQSMSEAHDHEHPEHNPGEPEFGEHSEDAPHNPGEPAFGDEPGPEDPEDDSAERKA